MKILLTGATGFIGTYVYKQLIETDNELYIISRKNIIDSRAVFYKEDILNHLDINKIIAEIRPTILIHIAWDVTHNNFWDAPNNKIYVDASINLFDIFIKTGGEKIISIGSCAEYPTSPKPVSENELYKNTPLSVYGDAKNMVFQYLNSKYISNVIDMAWVRLFGVYGLGENKNRFFPIAVKSIKNKELLKIHNPDVFFDYVYVNDIAKFIVKSIELKNIGAINIGTGASLSMIDLYNTIKSYIDNGIFKVIRTISQPNVKSRIPNCEKLHNLGFKFKMQQGLETICSKALCNKLI